MKIIHNIALDVSRHGVQAAIPITKGENGIHRLVVTLRNKGVPIAFDDRDTAVIYFDTDTFDPVTIYTKDGVYPNSLVYDVTARASAEAGAKKATFQIFTRSLDTTFTADIAFNVCDNRTYRSEVLGSPPYAAVLKAAAAAEEYAKNLDSLKLEKGAGENSIQQHGNNAVGDNSFAIGVNTIASNQGQAAIGLYNNDNPDALFIVGNGTSNDDRKNAFEVLSDGTANLNGKRIVTDEDLGTKLDKVDNPDNTVLVYAAQEGNQRSVKATHTDEYGTIMYRSKSTGQAKIVAPTQPTHIANKQYVDDVAVNLSNEISIAKTSLNADITSTKGGLENEIKIVESIAKGANQAVSFISYKSVIAELNYAAKDKYNAGQNFYIAKVGVPDLWVYGKSSPSNTYTYTTDEEFVNLLTQNGIVQVGHYLLAALETQKVDLTEYPTISDMENYVNETILGGEW